VLGELAKRIVNAAAFFLAAVTFFLVPLGRKTAAQHLVAIFGTTPAREAADACADAGRRLAESVKALRAPPEEPPPEELDPAD
jgi:hypothetical protein